MASSLALETLRRIYAKISFYSEPGNRDDRKAFGEIAAIIQQPDVVAALGTATAAESSRAERPHAQASVKASAQASVKESPSVAPENLAEAEAKLHKALPGS